MTSFQEYLAAKQKSSISSVNTNQKNVINEDDTASTRGGEIDAFVFATAAIAFRAIKNSIVYARLQSLKNPYLEQYEKCGSGSSKLVFEHEGAGKKKDDLDNKKREIKVAWRKEEEKHKAEISAMREKKSTAKEAQKEAIGKQIEVKEIKHEQLKARKDNTLEKMGIEEERISNEIENTWEREKDKLKTMEEKISEWEEKFVLGGTFKKRWGIEISLAKREIDLAVNEKAREIATKLKDETLAKDLAEKEQEIKEKEAKLQQELKDVEATADEEDAKDTLQKIPTLQNYNEVYEEHRDNVDAVGEKWTNLEKNTKTPESYVHSDGSSLNEEKKESKFSPSKVIDLITKVVNNSSDEDRPKLAAEGITDIEKIKQSEESLAQLRLQVAKEVEKAAGEDSKGISALKKGFLDNDKVKPTIEKDATDAKELYKKELEDLQDKSGGETSTKDETPEVDQDSIKKQEEKIASIEKDITALQEKPISKSYDEGIKKFAIANKEKELQKEKKILDDLKTGKNSGGDGKKESLYVKFSDFVNEKSTFNYFPAPEMLAQINTEYGNTPDGEPIGRSADNSLETFLKKSQSLLSSYEIFLTTASKK
jgi:hypothetical protein